MGRWYVPLDGTELPSREEVGGKARSLAQMRLLGLPVPPAFVLPTSVCHAYLASDRTLPPEAERALRTGVAYLEQETERSFGTGAAAAARIGTLRGPGEHARHDGHMVPGSRHERCRRAGPRGGGLFVLGTPATRTPGSSRDTRTSC